MVEDSFMIGMMIGKMKSIHGNHNHLTVFLFIEIILFIIMFNHKMGDI